MEKNKSSWRGCLLGLAVGDAMGYTVDGLNWEKISGDYGPDGLKGYDLVNGYADVSSYTQLTAYTSCALLVGLTRSQLLMRTAPYMSYVEQAAREWSHCQHLRRQPENSQFWVSQAEELRRRHCMDTRMLDALSREKLGTPAEPVNTNDSPGALTAAVSVGAFYDPARLAPTEIGKLGMETVAMTHGDPETFLSGAVVAYAVAAILQDKQTPLREHFLQAVDMVQMQFGQQYPQMEQLQKRLHRAVLLSSNHLLPGRDAMEHLVCGNAGECLAGAIYASLRCQEDFDEAMVLAVNHSGHSAAVGALTGAFLGARLGEEAIPEFYLDCLEPAHLLKELADDLYQGVPSGDLSRFFDDSWDQKYIQGRQVDPSGWAEE